MTNYTKEQALRDCAQLWHALWKGPDWDSKRNTYDTVFPESTSYPNCTCPCCEFTGMINSGDTKCKKCPLFSLFKGNCENFGRGVYALWRQAVNARNEQAARSIAKRIYFSAISNLRKFKK